MTTRSRMLFAVVAAAALIGAPGAASAQDPVPQNQGPLVIERVHDGFVVAPDYKITNVNDHTSQLAGVYAGQVHDDRLLIGGAGYWLVNGRDGDSLGYGGLLIGWSTPSTRTIQFGGRALAGVGRATLGLNDVVAFATANDPRRTLRFGARPLRIRARDDFFVFEPQASVTARLAEHVGVSVGGGYRLACSTDVLGDRLNGPSGSIAVQLGW